MVRWRLLSTLRLPTEMNLRVRIPGWAQNEAMPSDLYRYETSSAQKIDIKINGVPVEYKIEKGYAF